ncbi:hypothetical protein DFH27DRAFT_245245 [Peziza echinospora]|nr:hypothetical protein DFH27DRAFT_245245 [Peziza echinospora]
MCDSHRPRIIEMKMRNISIPLPRLARALGRSQANSHQSSQNNRTIRYEIMSIRSPALQLMLMYSSTPVLHVPETPQIRIDFFAASQRLHLWGEQQGGCYTTTGGPAYFTASQSVVPIPAAVVEGWGCACPASERQWGNDELSNLFFFFFLFFFFLRHYALYSRHELSEIEGPKLT